MSIIYEENELFNLPHLYLSYYIAHEQKLTQHIH